MPWLLRGQVDLESASIRPGESPDWLRAFKNSLLSSVRSPRGAGPGYTAAQTERQLSWDNNSASQLYGSDAGGAGSYSDNAYGDNAYSDNAYGGRPYSDGNRRGRERGSEVAVHCGNWSHDLDQARLLEGIPQVWCAAVHRSVYCAAQFVQQWHALCCSAL